MKLEYVMDLSAMATPEPATTREVGSCTMNNTCNTNTTSMSLPVGVDATCCNGKRPSLYHALVVIFLEFFALGLLSITMMSVLSPTFRDQTFPWNDLVNIIKGPLTFLSAPLMGALSDVYGRKPFLLVTVFFTCLTIPLMTINTFWSLAMFSVRGVCAPTLSIVFAYVADIIEYNGRSFAYGLVCVTCITSTMISSLLGGLLMERWSMNVVVALATAIVILDVLFILLAVPESLPEEVRVSPISWRQAKPFASLRSAASDPTILLLCISVFLSSLPEAGQFSCIFVYLKLVMGWSTVMAARMDGLSWVVAVMALLCLGKMMNNFGWRRTIMLGLFCEMLMLLLYGFGRTSWMMWAAGYFASLSSITYPAISVFASIRSNADRQGVVQGMVTGIRGLCYGLGPTMFSFIFDLFQEDFSVADWEGVGTMKAPTRAEKPIVPGPPFVFGAFLVLCALIVASLIPTNAPQDANGQRESPAQEENEHELMEQL